MVLHTTGKESTAVEVDKHDFMDSNFTSHSGNNLKEPINIPSSPSLSGSSADTQDEDGQLTGNSSKQMVLYDPKMGGNEQLCNPNPIRFQRPPNSLHSTPPKVLPSIGAFTVQCAKCFKWRFIPTKEKYEEIRERILENPFVCEAAAEWRPDISCDDATDISQDGSRLWAIDKPNIAQAPRGWQRLLRIRAEGSTKFADVYYQAPTGKRLRSMVEIQKYLIEHPELMKNGLTLSQFSFQIPKPLQENYVRKRPSVRVGPSPIAAEPAEARPLAWASPDGTMLQLGMNVSDPPSKKAKKKEEAGESNNAL